MIEEKKVKDRRIIKLIILLLLLISLIFLKEENRESFKGFLLSLSNSEKELQLVTSINSPGTSHIKVYGNNIFLFRNNAINLFDMEGNLNLEEQFNFEDLMVHFGDNSIYIGDRSSGEIKKWNKNGQAESTIDFNKAFFNIKEEDKHTIYHSKSETIENIYIYDKNNVLIGDHGFSHKNIINYSIHPSSSKYALSLLDLEENTIKSELHFYGLNNELLSTFEINGEILIYSKLLKGDNIIALTDTSLYYINNGEVIWSKSFSLIKDIYVDDKIYILYSNYLESISLDGKTIDKISFAGDYKKIIAFKRNILVYGDNGLQLILDGEEKLSFTGKIDLLSVGKNNIVIVNNDIMDIYKIVKK